MAAYYVYSGAGGAGTGADWANAYTTLAAALTARLAGDTFYVAQDHNEAPAGSITLTSPGTLAARCLILCVNRAGSVPPVAADITTGALLAPNGNNFAITFGGHAYSKGVEYRGGTTGSTSNLNGSSSHDWIFEDATLRLPSTTGASILVTPSGVSNANRQVWRNVTTRFGATTQRISLAHGELLWLGGSVSASGSAPATLFNIVTTRAPAVTLRGVDLSHITGSIWAGGSTAAAGTRYLLENCKMGAGFTPLAAAIGSAGPEFRMVNCDSADTNYRFYLATFAGEIFHETTIVRTGGASDGTTPISRKMVSNANSKFEGSLVSDPIDIWIDTPGAYTGTIEVLTDNVTLTDAEAWIEVEYLGTSGFPLSSFANDRASNILSTPANQTTSSETWTTTGLGTPVKQALAVAFTTAEKGWARFRVRLAKASTTLYFDPEVNGLGITSGRQWQGAGAYINEGAAGGGLSRRGRKTGGFSRSGSL